LSLLGSAARGAAWTILTGIGSRLVGLFGTLWLTYYLAPEVQGEVSDAFIVVLTAHQFSTLGVQQYLVAGPEPEKGLAFHVTVFQLFLGLVAFGLVVLLRDSFGGFLHAPTMGQYVPGLAVAMFLERLGTVPERLLSRKMQFRTIGISRTVGEMAYTVVSVVLAWRGLGGMAIVYGNIARTILWLGVLASAVPRASWLSPTRLSFEVLRPALRYGLPLWVGAFAGFVSRRWDNLVVSSLFGAQTVGEYNLAYNLADIPATQVGEQIGDVLFPSFSRMEPEERKRALVRSTGLLALVVFPLAVGLGAVAPTVVHVMLRPEWYGVAPMLVILSALSVTRPIGWTIQAYLQGSNRPRASMWLGLAKIAFLISAMILLGKLTHEPLWTCGAVGIAFGLHSLASMFVVSHDDGVSVWTMLGRCASPLLATLPMAAAIYGVRVAMAHAGVPPVAGLVAELVTGAAAYVAGAFVLARGPAMEFTNLLRDAIRRRRGKA
jgi:lipopolysaccharide exporter